MVGRLSLSAVRLLLVLGSVLLLTTVGLVFLSRRPTSDSSELSVSSESRSFPVLSSKAEILKETEPESIEQSIEALPSSQDWVLAATTTGLSFCPEAYSTMRMVIPRLTRVRKLLGQIQEQQKPHYTALFLHKMKECQTGYARSRKEQIAAYIAKGPQLDTEPSICDKKQSVATALVYILAQWESQAALLPFARLLEQPDPLPVNRLFLLYSTHLLIRSMPTSGFSEEKRARLTAYNRLAGKLLPDAERVTAAAWNARYDEFDFRRVILGESVPIDAQPTISLTVYPDIARLEFPANLTDGWKLTEEADGLQRTMLSFLRAK